VPTYRYTKQYGKFNDVKPEEGTSMLIRQIINSMIKMSEDLNLTPLEVVSLIDSQIGGTYERKDVLVKIYVNLNEEQKRFAQGVGSGRFMVATIMDMVLRSESTLLGFIGQIGLIRRQLFGEGNFDTQVKPKVIETEVETEVEPEVKTVVEPEAKPKVTKPKPKVEVKPVVESKPKEIVEVKTEPKVEPKVEAKPEVKPTRRSKVAENLREGIGEVVVTNTLIDDFM
jgi:hypothetical protein